MPKLIGMALAGLFLVGSANPEHEQFARYKAIEAYEIRPGILMMPTYSADGKVCEIGLEKLHYSPEVIRLDSSLTRDEINQIFEELVPANERGPRSKDLAGRDLILEDGLGFTTIVDFENVSIQISGRELQVSKKRRVAEDGIAATLRWKNRKCS